MNISKLFCFFFLFFFLFFVFFMYIRDFHERKHKKKIFSQVLFVLILWACKIIPGNSLLERVRNVLWKPTLRLFFGRSLDLHTAVWFFPKKLPGHVVVKDSLKAIPQNHKQLEKTSTLRTSISPHLHTGFLGVIVIAQAYLHEQHFIFVTPQSSSRNWVGM